MKETRWLFVVLATCTFVASCTSIAEDKDPDTTLANAVERTVEAESFHIDTLTTIDGEESRAEVDYVAPDRFHIRSLGDDGFVTITIGRDVYDSDFGELDKFTANRWPCNVGVEELLPALSLVGEAEQVRTRGESYVFSTRGDPMSLPVNRETLTQGEARIEDGYLISLLLRYEVPQLDQQVEERYTFSRFGEGISIEPPPPEQVSPASGSGDFPDVIVVEEGSPAPCP